MRNRRRLLNLSLALLVTWALLATVREVRHLQWRHEGGRWLADEPCLWRLGTPPTERLEQFLAAVQPAVRRDRAEGGVVYFSSRFDRRPPARPFSAADRDALCTYLWAVYLFPQATLRWPPPDRAQAGSLWLAYATPLPEGIERLVVTPHGTLGRVMPHGTPERPRW